MSVSFETARRHTEQISAFEWAACVVDEVGHTHNVVCLA
jgi:hypothetical protein